MDLIRSKKLRPIQAVKTFTFSQIEEAFRFMQAGKHVGKVVAVPNENDIVPVSSLGLFLSRLNTNH